MGEIKSCSAPGCEGNLADVLRQRSLSVEGGAEGFSLVQRSVALVLVMGCLFASFALVETITPLHGLGVLAIAALTFVALNPELWTFFGSKRES
jgi:hypothetical protein